MSIARPASSTNNPCPTLKASVSISAYFNGARARQNSQANVSTDANLGCSKMRLRLGVTVTDTGAGGGPNSTPAPGGRPVPESPMAKVCSTLVHERRPPLVAHSRNRIAVVLLGRMSDFTSKLVTTASRTATALARHAPPANASTSNV